MLKRFLVPEADRVFVSEEAVRRATKAIFLEMGQSELDAEQSTDVLVVSDLRGCESHGVSNMLPAYIEQYRKGEINPNPSWKLERETAGTAVINADRGLGIILGRHAMNMAINKAKDVGVGIVTMNNAGHLGAVGHFSMIAAEPLGQTDPFLIQRAKLSISCLASGTLGGIFKSSSIRRTA